jgi:hypothetical protein
MYFRIKNNHYRILKHYFLSLYATSSCISVFLEEIEEFLVGEYQNVTQMKNTSSIIQFNGLIKPCYFHEQNKRDWMD